VRFQANKVARLQSAVQVQPTLCCLHCNKHVQKRKGITITGTLLIHHYSLYGR